MKWHQTVTMVAGVALMTASTVSVLSEESRHHQAGNAMTDEELVKSAMAAARAKISEYVMIIAPTVDGKMKTLKKGTNNFTCRCAQLARSCSPTFGL